MARLAKSLAILRDEVNKAAPNRSKASDGWIGDPAHASRASRHNPNNAGVVCALDITHDPAHGMDVHALARWLVKGPHPDLEYVISNGQVASRTTGWQWREYGGSNPHTKHAHFAVGRGPDSEPRPPYDTTAPWGVVAPEPPPPPQEDDPMTADPRGTARICMREYLGRSPETYAELDWHAGQILALGLNGYIEWLEQQTEAIAWADKIGAEVRTPDKG